jgi:hypothetical protein
VLPAGSCSHGVFRPSMQALFDGTPCTMLSP